MDIIVIPIMVFIFGIVAIAWRLRVAHDEKNNGLNRTVPSVKAQKRQIQTSALERVEKKQVEISKKVDQILEIISKENIRKTKEKKTQKTDTKKTVSRQKKKSV